MQPKEADEIEESIAIQLEYAHERQPIRWEVYIKHIKYLKNKIRRLEQEMNKIIK